MGKNNKIDFNADAAQSYGVFVNDAEREVGNLKEELENMSRFINSNKFILDMYKEDMYKEFLQKDK